MAAKVPVLQTSREISVNFCTCKKYSRNPNARTIESELLDAMVKAGVISQEGADDPGSKVLFTVYLAFLILGG